MLTRREMIVAIGAVALATPAWAVHPNAQSPRVGDPGADETFKGEMVCAKCFLNKPDAKECQDVLLVKDGGATTEYYITKNKVAQESGEACTQAIPAVVIGTVKQTDGRKWLTASKITKG